MSIQRKQTSMFFSSKEFKQNLKLQIRSLKEKTKLRKLAEKQEKETKRLAEKQEKETKKLAEKQEKETKRHFKKCLKNLVQLPKFNQDGRHVARANETIRIEQIVSMMNDKESELGMIMCNDYTNKFGKTIDYVKLAGTNNDHFDFVIYHTDNTRVRVEEKHSEKNLNTDVAPWKDSVQVLNGVGSQFLVGEKLARHWYNEIILPTDWNNILQTDDIPEIPSYEEWSKDAFRCGDPKSKFVIAIKKRCREIWGDKSSFTGLNNTPDLRNSLSEFELNQEEKVTFINQIKEKLDNVLSQKDCFLQTKGSIELGNFEFSWRDPVESPNITNIRIRREKDIFIDLIDEKNDSFTGILRWGKGCGFTNIRFDVR